MRAFVKTENNKLRISEGADPLVDFFDVQRGAPRLPGEEAPLLAAAREVRGGGMDKR